MNDEKEQKVLLFYKDYCGELPSLAAKIFVGAFGHEPRVN